MKEIIDVTPEGLKKVKELLESNGKFAVRLAVNGKGCSGFSYEIDFTDGTEPGDEVFEKEGARIVIDAMSLPFLVGTRIDWVSGVMGSHFDFKNPNAVSTCGCGTSFSVGS